MGEAELIQQTRKEMALIDALMPTIREMARKHVARTQTDFLGRMAEAIMEAEACCEPHQVLDEDRREEFNEAVIELASLALAQAAMSTAPIAVLPTPPQVSEGTKP